MEIGNWLPVGKPLPVPPLLFARRSDGGRKDLCQFRGFLTQATDLLRCDQLPRLDEFHPPLTLVGFFRNDADFRSEFVVRPTSTGRSVVESHPGRRLRELTANGRSRFVLWQLFEECARVESKSHRACLETFGLVAHAGTAQQARCHSQSIGRPLHAIQQSITRLPDYPITRCQRRPIRRWYSTSRTSAVWRSKAAARRSYAPRNSV